jgi:predicted DNA-binding transcriptional regulator YafY
VPRGDGLTRQLQLYLLLDSERELGVDDAAKRLGCARRTVYRDLVVLQRIGMPLYQEQRGRHARWRVVDGFRRRVSIALSVHELIALLVAGRQLTAADPGGLGRHADAALGKIAGTLDAGLRQQLEAIAGRLSASPSSPTIKGSTPEVVAQLMAAVSGQNVVELNYQKLQARTPARYTVEPHHLHVQGGAVYLIGYVRERRRSRVFHLSRLRGLRVLPEVFERRPEVDGAAFAHGAFGVWGGPLKRVRLRFTGRAASVVAERQYHPSQANQLRSDGDLDVTLRVPLSPALEAWVRGFGDGVRLLEPQSLAADV